MDRNAADLAERGAGASQNYYLRRLLYVLMLMLISKVLELPLEYYGFRLEPAITSPTRSFAPGSGRMQEFLIGLVMARIVVNCSTC